MKKLILITIAILLTTSIGYSVVYAFSPQYGINNGLVGYWSFDRRHTPWTSSTAATTIDMSGNGNTGTLTNMAQATSPVAGKIGQGLMFDGSNDYVNVGTLGSWGSQRNNGFSVSFWVKVNSSSAIYAVMAMAEDDYGKNSISIRVNSKADSTVQAGSVRIAVASSDATVKILSGATNANSVPTNTWTHVVATVLPSANIVSIYVNGVSKSITYGLQQTPINFSNFSRLIPIGSNNAVGTLSQYFPGSIDDVRIYNRALSAAEVTQLYRMGLSGNPR